jgi:hypothetical protein
MKASLFETSQLRPFLSLFKHKINVHEVIGVECSKICGVDVMLLHPGEALIDEVRVELDPEHVIGFPLKQVLYY